MFARLRSWIGGLLGRNKLESDMDAELRLHMEHFAEDLVRSGVSRTEAERRARMEFGSVAAAKEECRQARGLYWPDEIARNMRFAFRTLRKSPTFTITAVATLALCIGANTAIYSVVDAVLLRPLAYPEPEQLGSLVIQGQGAEGDSRGLSHTGMTWEAFRDQATTVDLAVVGWSRGVSLVTGNRAEYVQQQRVSAGFFHVLGLAPIIGREFTEEEDRSSGPAVVILSYSLWERVFQRGSVLGESVLVRGETCKIVGVAAPDFRSDVPADVWTPLRPSATGEGGGNNYHIIARLRPNATWPQAKTEVKVIGAALMQNWQPPPRAGDYFDFIALREALTGEVRRPLLILWGAVGMVLLVGCVNIAGLMLARVSTRRREIATRMALGGGRMAVLRQMLSENLVLGLSGGIGGVALGYAGVNGLALLVQKKFGIWQAVRVDERVLTATLFTAIAASVLFGLMPTIRACQFDLRSGLAESRRGVAGRRNHWSHRLLVAGEVATVMMLLVGDGLLIRTYFHLRLLSPGFDPTNVLTAQIPLEDARYTTASSVNLLFEKSLARMRELPGVEFAAASLTLPYERGLNWGFRQAGGSRQPTSLVYVTPEYFPALRIPLLRGRLLSQKDQAESADVIVINRSFASRYVREQEQLGGFINIAGSDREIVGIVGDVQQRPSWGGDGPLWSSPTVYIPAAQVGDGFVQLVHTWFPPSFVVRTTGDQTGLAPRIQEAVQGVDALLPFAGFRSMSDVREESLAAQRFQMVLLTVLAALALVLAVVGIYGLIANSVAERTREMGIRLALGATAGKAVQAMALPGIALGLAGVLTGSIAAWMTVPVMRNLIFGVPPTDPWTFGGVAAGLLLVASLASLLPALRVARLNPAATLRNE
jgi:predicted permease